MKIHALSPARAAWAATAFARLPVEAQPIVSSPNAAAALIAAATTRSLNDSDGWQTVSFLTQARVTPRRRDSAGSPSNGSHSLYRQSEGARAAIALRLGSRRRGSYTGSSGPRHCSQIETGPAARSAPQLRQRSGRALSQAREATGAVVDVIETSTKMPGRSTPRAVAF